MLQANPTLDWRDVQHILIETADKNPGEDWAAKTNAAGYSHSHDYGFGRINAKKAVEAALIWKENTVPDEIEEPVIGIKKGKQTIPENEEGIKISIDDIDKNIKAEFAEIILDIEHELFCDLEITLFSPHETESILAQSGCYYSSLSLKRPRKMDLIIGALEAFAILEKAQ